jgi:hypothetical protein
VNVDGLDPLAAYRHRQGLARRLLGAGAMRHSATAKDNAGGGADTCFKEITAGRHDEVLPGFCFLWLRVGQATGRQQGGRAGCSGKNPIKPA